jgi:copper transporter 1
MVPYLHFIGGDALFFEGLKPTSASAIAGACIVLFAIALFERWVSGKRSAIESRWRQKYVNFCSMEHWLFRPLP